MAASFDSLRLRNQRAMDRRLTADHRQLARALAGLVVQAATGRDEAGEAILPPSRKALDDLKAAVWERVRAYYIGNGTDALDGPNPRSPYALLLVTGIAQATRIQAERQAALVRRLVKDPEVVRWLTGPRPMLPTREMMSTFAGRITELTLTPTRDTLAGLRGADGRIDTARARAALVRPRGTYEPFHSWVDPNGYRLSDRIWRTSIDVRSRIDLLLDYEVARGTSAVAIANMLEPFLTPGGAESKTLKPYGREGSFSARRLARTEITAAAGRATVNAAAANPFVAQLQWRLSPSHPKIDRCDDHARGGPNGDGIYDIDKLPRYPDHPHCLCSILPVPSGSTADLVQTLRADIRAARGNLIDAASGGDPGRARALQGTLSPEYLTQAMMTGNLDDAVAQAVRQAQTVRPEVAVVEAPPWKPSMSRAEADAWVADSAIKEDTFHVTATKNVSSLTEDGFDLSRTEFGRAWGDGVYVGSNQETADLYVRRLAESGDPGTVLPIKLNVNKPFTVQADDIEAIEATVFGAQTRTTSIVRMVTGVANNDEAMAILTRAGEEASGISFQADMVRNMSAGLTKVLEDNGYDALWIKVDRVEFYTGGDQIVVFDPRKVVIVQ